MDPKPVTILKPFPVASDRAWLDPLLVGRNLFTDVADYSIPGAGRRLTAVPDPMRWAIGFTMSPLVAFETFVGPWSDVDSSCGAEVEPGRILWYTLTIHGPLVQCGWYMSSGNPSSVRVIEVRRAD